MALRAWHEYYYNWIIKYEDILDWNQLSKNKNISLQIIESNPSKPWNYWFLSQNPNITKEFIMKNQNKHLDWNYIAENIKLDYELIKLINTKIQSIIPLCKNSSLNIRHICGNTFNWDYNTLSRYLKLNKWTMKIFGDYSLISFNKSLYPHMIEALPSIRWNYFNLSENTNITQKFVEKKIDEEWNWYYLSGNENISIRFILEKSNLEHLNWKVLSARKDLDYEILIDYQDSPWYWQIISKSKNKVPFEFIKYLNKEIISKWYYFQSLEEYEQDDIDFLNNNVHYYDSFSKNDMVNFGKIKDIQLEYLDFYYISQNKKLTFDFIDTHISQRWDFSHISNNNFEYQKRLFIENLNLN